MQLFNDRKLARRLRDGLVPSREKLCYLLISQIMMTAFLSSSLQSLVYEPLDRWSVATDILTIFSVAAGVIWVYLTNKKGDNKEFIERFTCIDIPLIFQLTLLLLVMIIVMIPAIWFAPADTNFFENETYMGIGDLLITGMFMLFYFVRMNGAIRIASDAKE